MAVFTVQQAVRLPCQRRGKRRREGEGREGGGGGTRAVFSRSHLCHRSSTRSHPVCLTWVNLCVCPHEKCHLPSFCFRAPSPCFSRSSWTFVALLMDSTKRHVGLRSKEVFLKGYSKDSPTFSPWSDGPLSPVHTSSLVALSCHLTMWNTIRDLFETSIYKSP